jgi:predicted small metal-binding protein
MNCAVTIAEAMKEFSCGDVVPGCTASFRSPNDDQLFDEIARHARESHGLEQLSPELIDAVRKRIRTVGRA